MSETTLLRQNAIRNNASVGATTPGPVKTGELPLVQVKPVPTAAPIQASQQQKAVQILAPNSKGVVTQGELPMVQIKMTQNGPQQDDGGHDSPVVIRENRQPTLSAGGLPGVQVKSDGARPQVKTMPNVHGAPPRIPTAAPALSAPRIAQAGVTRVAAPVAAPVAPSVPLPDLPELTTEQLMLCQHALNKYVADSTAATTESEAGSESEAVQLAKATIATIDDLLVAVAVHAEAAANAPAAEAPAEIMVVAAPAVRATGYVAPRAGTGGYYSPAALAPQAHVQVAVPAPALAVAPSPTPSPAPRSGGFVMQQPSVRRTQLNTGLVPRGVPRAKTGALPMVQVKMEGQKAVVQNKAEIEAAKAAREAQAQAAESVDGSQGAQGPQA